MMTQSKSDQAPKRILDDRMAPVEEGIEEDISAHEKYPLTLFNKKFNQQRDKNNANQNDALNQENLKKYQARKAEEIAGAAGNVIGPISSVGTIASLIFDSLHPNQQLTEFIPLSTNALGLFQLLWKTVAAIFFSTEHPVVRALFAILAFSILGLSTASFVMATISVLPALVTNIGFGIQGLYFLQGLFGLSLFLYKGIPTFKENNLRLETLKENCDDAGKLISLSRYSAIQNEQRSTKKNLALNLHGIAMGLGFTAAIVLLHFAPYIGIPMLLGLSIYTFMSAVRMNPVTEGIKSYFRPIKKCDYRKEYREKKKTLSPAPENSLQGNMSADVIRVLSQDDRTTFTNESTDSEVYTDESTDSEAYTDESTDSEVYTDVESQFAEEDADLLSESSSTTEEKLRNKSPEPKKYPTFSFSRTNSPIGNPSLSDFYYKQF